MSGFLFDKWVFGPIQSRRLGSSLGINLLPVNKKLCNFDCVYCECGWTEGSHVHPKKMPTRKNIRELLSEKLTHLNQLGVTPDNITFAGNGEPTLHPDFASIIKDTIKLRDMWAAHAGISVLSNASRVDRKDIREALLMVDQNILKLDAGSQQALELINRPRFKFPLSRLIENLKSFEGKLIIQSLFLKGKVQGQTIDNSQEAEVAQWLEHIQAVQPQSVMIYSIARETALQGLEALPQQLLHEIAHKVNKLGIKAQVF